MNRLAESLVTPFWHEDFNQETIASHGTRKVALGQVALRTPGPPAFSPSSLSSGSLPLGKQQQTM